MERATIAPMIEAPWGSTTASAMDATARTPLRTGPRLDRISRKPRIISVMHTAAMTAVSASVATARGALG